MFLSDGFVHGVSRERRQSPESSCQRHVSCCFFITVSKGVLRRCAHAKSAGWTVDLVCFGQCFNTADLYFAKFPACEVFVPISAGNTAAIPVFVAFGVFKKILRQKRPFFDDDSEDRQFRPLNRS